MRTFYAIIGPDSESNDQQYWDVNQFDWTSEFEQATHYNDGGVFFIPLPPGAQGIMEFTEENEPVRWFEAGDPPLPGEVAGI